MKTKPSNARFRAIHHNFRLFAPHLLIAALFAAQAIHANTADFIRHYVGPLAEKGRVVIDAGDSETTAYKPNHAYAKSEIVSVEGQRFGKALRIQVTQRADDYKVEMLTVPSTHAIKKDDQLVVVYAARCTKTMNESGASWAKGYIQRRNPWYMMRGFEVNVGPEWQVCIHKFKLSQDLEAGEARIAIHLGQYEQVTEFGPIVLIAYPPDMDLSAIPISKYTYAGREPGAPWRAEAQARIEKIRKGDLRISVSDANGPVSGAKVQVRMKRHAYEFGTYLEGPCLWNEKNSGPQKAADGEKYRQVVKELFNRVTCPLYWKFYYDKPERPQLYRDIAAWAQKQGFSIRGHTLVYPGKHFMPKTIVSLSNDLPAMRKAIEDSIAERMAIGKEYGFKDYDVVNEMRDQRYPMNLLGWDVVPRWFQQCKAIHPEALMGINENTILASYGDNRKQRETYHSQINAILAGGAKVEVIGFQCHFGANPTGPEQVFQRIEEFAKYGVPLHATELDVDTDDEELQGDYLRDFLTIFFSHPSTKAITQWGFWEGQHWLPRAALFRKDWSLKPNGKAYKDLVFGQWWTNADLVTDSRGGGKIRGFLGDYQVIVTAAGKTKTVDLKLTSSGHELPVVMD